MATVIPAAAGDDAATATAPIPHAAAPAAHAAAATAAAIDVDDRPPAGRRGLRGGGGRRRRRGHGPGERRAMHDMVHHRPRRIMHPRDRLHRDQLAVLDIVGRAVLLLFSHVHGPAADQRPCCDESCELSDGHANRHRHSLFRPDRDRTSWQSAN